MMNIMKASGRRTGLHGILHKRHHVTHCMSSSPPGERLPDDVTITIFMTIIMTASSPQTD